MINSIFWKLIVNKILNYKGNKLRYVQIKLIISLFLLYKLGRKLNLLKSFNTEKIN